MIPKYRLDVLLLLFNTFGNPCYPLLSQTNKRFWYPSIDTYRENKCRVIPWIFTRYRHLCSHFKLSVFSIEHLREIVRGPFTRDCQAICYCQRNLSIMTHGWNERYHYKKTHYIYICIQTNIFATFLHLFWNFFINSFWISEAFTKGWNCFVVTKNIKKYSLTCNICDELAQNPFTRRRESTPVNRKCTCTWVVPKVRRQSPPYIFQWKLRAQTYFMIYFNEYERFIWKMIRINTEILKL